MNVNEDGRQPLDVCLGSGPAHIEYAGGRYSIRREGNGCSKTIEGFELFDYIAKGSSGLVYKAISPKTGDIFVIKELFPLDLFQNKEIERCGDRIIISENVSPEREAAIRARYDKAFEEELKNGIRVRYDGLGKNDRFLAAQTELVYSDGSGQHILNRYLLTEAANGVTLDLFDLNSITGRPRVELILKIIIKLCDTVSDMHEKGLLHLDISARNVFLRGDARTLAKPEDALVSLLDFGSAKLISEDGSAAPGSIPFSASQETASTEVKSIAITGSAEGIKASADVSSVCLIMSQLLSRDIKNYRKGDPPNPTLSASVNTLSTGEQKELIHIINKGVNDIGRYASVEELKADLVKLIDDLGKKGISRNIIRRSAEEKAAKMRRTMKSEGFVPELLCRLQRADEQT